MSYAERLVINDESRTSILYDEHIVRYQFIAPLVKGKRVLDIACGSGYGSALLAQAGALSVIGIDLDKQAVDSAKQNYKLANLEFRTGDAIALSLADKSIDFISSFETIEHLPKVDEYLKELARVSNEEAIVCISTPNIKVFAQKNPFHLKEFTKEEFEQVLKKHFPVVRLFEQKNSLSSFIKGSAGSEASLFINNEEGEALYFIAICSYKEIELNLLSTGSFNTRALIRWQNNPGWRLVNAIYAFLQKLGIRS